MGGVESRPEVSNTKRGVKGFLSVPALERFWAKVKKTDSCWLWQGATNGGGYGVFWADGKRIAAHRFIFGHTEKLVLHRCDNPPCVRPSHLFEGTHAENMQDAVAKKRIYNITKTHCNKGHPFDEANTYWTKEGRRDCRVCRKLRDQAWNLARPPRRAPATQKRGSVRTPVVALRLDSDALTPHYGMFTPLASPSRSQRCRR